MKDIYIAGIGMTPLGRHLEKSVKDLSAWAIRLALEDAGGIQADIETAWFSNTRQGQMEGQNSIRGQCALHACGFSGIPVFNVENACASSSSAVALCTAYIRSGMADVGLVVGTEKMIYPDKKDVMLAAFMGGTDVHAIDRVRQLAGMQVVGRTEQAQRSFFMDLYAALARAHMRLYGTSERQLAAVAAKNHWHSTMNPLAQYQTDMTVEEVLADKAVVWPLTRAMCAPLSDGAAAAVICSREGLARLRSSGAIRIAGIGVASAQHRGFEELDRHCARLAAKRAYAMAGISPAEIDVVEVHDATSFAEILQLENLGICDTGRGGALVDSGATRLGGKIPTNTSGGLVSKGHPIAATGLIQMHELVAQLRGQAGLRQVANARIGVAENGGGWVGVEEAACVITVLERAEGVNQ
jgi:acetyl-CoA acetyltransferase